MRKVFRNLITPEEALKRLYSYFKPGPIGVESVGIESACGRVLAEDVYSKIDVPGFDRATVDGYAVRAEDTFGADEENPRKLKVVGALRAGESKGLEVKEGEAVEVATGAVMPKGANAVLMVEYTNRVGDELEVYRPVPYGENVMAAGSDIMAGELILRKGTVITPREVGVLASLGMKEVKVYRKPRVGVISTGDELLEPGEPLEYGKIYDVNTYTVSSSVRECGGEPVILGPVRDDPELVKKALLEALERCDLVLTSGSTSAGAGDFMYRFLDGLGEPGVLAHGLSFKPGKPTVIALVGNKPVIGLPGYPTSCLMVFNTLVRPILLAMAGRGEEEKRELDAIVARRIYSARGRRELLPVYVVEDEGRYLVYDVGLGSGAVSSFGLSDGYITIPEEVELVEEGGRVRVRLFGSELKPSELVIIGSHCVGIDLLLGLMDLRSYKVINVGSMGGLKAVERGEADLAGVHLLDEKTGEYNIPFVKRFGLIGKAVLVRGYLREQGILVRKGNPRGIKGIEDLLEATIINRNKGSGTRILLDLLLKEACERKGLKFEEVKGRIKGYNVEAKTHSAVASAVASGRADAGLAIRSVAKLYGLDFIKVADEHYDFLIPKRKMGKKSVRKFIEALGSEEFKRELRRRDIGLVPTSETGKVILS